MANMMTDIIHYFAAFDWWQLKRQISALFRFFSYKNSSNT
jgi:hypothetical protein